MTIKLMTKLALKKSSNPSKIDQIITNNFENIISQNNIDELL